MQETLEAEPGSCHPGTLHLVILANVTTMNRQALPVALCQSESKTNMVLVGKAVIRIFFFWLLSASSRFSSVNGHMAFHQVN